jgi:glycosyltransferase involved in cell wall biosynthesis
MSTLEPELKILVLSRHASSQGGIVNFIETLKSRLTGRTKLVGFVCGSRPDERGTVRKTVRLVRDPIALFLQLCRNRYDAVHVNTNLEVRSLLRDSIFLAVLKLTRFRGSFVFFHGWLEELEHPIAANPLYRNLFRWLFGGAARIAVLSNKFRDFLIRIGFDPDRIIVFSTMFDGEELERARQIPEKARSRRTILFLSRFIKEKGMYELLEAYRRIADRFPDVDLVMAGDGDEAERIKGRVAAFGLTDRVKFPGYLRGKEKARVLLDAEIFALPTYSEGLPVALLEAMAAGTALIVSHAGGIGEVVRSPENGIVLDEISIPAITAALERMLADPGYVAEVSERNKMIAWQRYESRIVVDNIEAIYHDIVSEQRRPRTIAQSERG